MLRKIALLFICMVAFAVSAAAQFTISGIVRDAKTSEPMVGATILLSGTTNGTATGADGSYTLTRVPAGNQKITALYLSYKTAEVDVAVSGDIAGLDVAMESDMEQIERVIVSSVRRSDTESAMVGTVRAATQVVSGVSAAQISKSPDRTASEVVRRVPGITIIDERFIVVRGLAQRYNNASLNGLALPSTETDSRAFSFDLIPGGQIDNMLVYKSPSPEIPGDFSGGFVKITTKSLPDANSTDVGVQTGFNVKTQFTDFRINPGSGTDFLGFDAGKRTLGKDFPAHLGSVTDPAEITRLTRDGFNDDWSIRNSSPLPDVRLSFNLARRFDTRGGKTIGNITSINYSNTHKTIEGIKNARYGIYSASADKPVVLNDYTDNQYSNDVRIGAMHNWSLILNSQNRLEFRNIFNLLGRNRLTERTGLSLNSGEYRQRQTEMLYSSLLTYAGQLSGTHSFGNKSSLVWDAGYSYADRNEPDRRISKYTGGLNAERLYLEELKRYFQKLEDQSISVSAAFKQPFRMGGIEPTLGVGVYGEMRVRDYSPREFEYEFHDLPYEERNEWVYLPVEDMLTDRYLGAGRVYIHERPESKNSAYSADVTSGAAYAALTVPVGALSVHAGARLESYNTALTYDRSASATEQKMITRRVEDLNLLPSINATYSLGEKQQLRAAYGRSVNRPELRELSPAIYYDFDLFSEIGGNPDLKTALIDNVDLRWEFYPARGETVSVSAFYKHFRNPIEWTFVDTGGTYQYRYQNAREAVSKGVELDVRKNLDFVGLRDFSLVLNTAWILSRVSFEPGEVVSEPDRPMQGQSPYIINAGLYYSSERLGLDAAILFNRIGKRIVGLGKVTSSDASVNSIIPDSYEMPRNTLDLSFSKKLGERISLRATVKDILSQDVVYKQFPKFVKDGMTQEREQITRSYNPGQSFTIGVTIKL